MTQDERKMLEDLADRFARTPAPPKDAEAEDFIRTRIGSRPDALYLMTQTVLIQNLALQQAQQQLQELQRSPGAGPVSSGSFLAPQNQPRSSGYSGSQYAAPAAPAPPTYAQPSPAAPSPQVAASGGGAPSFLRGAAQTAAGVAAGALAFEGIQSLFSHPGYGGGGGFFGGGGYAPPVEETVVNNYYDNPGAGNDFSNNRDDFQATDDATNYDDSGNYDDGSSSGFDDGGFDDGGGGGDTFV
ncbi:MAG: DUF2076 family protein [Acidobacteriaceae bacterium]|nr:DUF2076 family protein [Acidobacteriaceae bacterium]